MSIKFFSLKDGQATELALAESPHYEAEIHESFERNLEKLLNVRFLKSKHFMLANKKSAERRGGKEIDTLGIDAQGRPVIIEYKRGRDDGIINQAFGYVARLKEQQTEFYKLVLNKLGAEEADKIHWDDIRVICVAAEFSIADRAMAEDHPRISLVCYTRFGEGLLGVEWLSGHAPPPPTAETEATKTKTETPPNKNAPTPYEDMAGYIQQMQGDKKTHYETLHNFFFSLGNDIKDRPTKYYMAFARENDRRTFAWIEFRQKFLILSLGLDKESIRQSDGFIQDMSATWSHPTANSRCRITSSSDIEQAKDYIRRSYEAV